MRDASALPRMIAALLFSILVILVSSSPAQTIKERNDALFEQIQRVHGLSEDRMETIRSIFRASPYIGQGNPAITEHPVTLQG